MQINKQLYIPDQETFVTNQGNDLTENQQDLYDELNFARASLKHETDTFWFNTKERSYQFKHTPLNFLQSRTPFINQDSHLMPGVKYDINFLQVNRDSKIFLSSKMIPPKSDDEVYETMVSALCDRLEFSRDDLICNKSNMLSSGQLRKFRKNLKEYDPDPSIGTMEFVFAGFKTEKFPMKDMNYFQKLTPYFHNNPDLFLFNVKYRIFYEKNDNNFLSIEPIEILENKLYQPPITNIAADKQLIESKQPKKVKSKRPKKKMSLPTKLYLLLIIIFIYFVLNLEGRTTPETRPMLAFAGFIAFLLIIRNNNQKTRK